MGGRDAKKCNITLRLTRQVIGIFYNPGGGLVRGELNYLDPKNVRYIFDGFKLFLA